MSNEPPAGKKSDWRYQVFRSFGIWLTHVVAGTALFVVLFVPLPNFDEIAQAKEWPLPVVTHRIIWESRWIVNYLWFLSPIAAGLDLALLMLLNVAGGRWRLSAGLWHNVFLLGVLLNILFAYMSTDIVYRAELNPNAEEFLRSEDVDAPHEVDE